MATRSTRLKSSLNHGQRAIIPHTPYQSSGVDRSPESGLARNITTFYPTDTVNNQIHYSRIYMSIPVSQTIILRFVPPEGSAVRCGYLSGPTDAENFNPEKLPVG